MPTQDEIDQQRRRLEAHRATLAHYLDQVSLLGVAYTPPGVGAGIREARAGIAQCKAALHGWGIAVDHHPDDDAASPQPLAPTGVVEVERALRAALPAESQAQAPGLARLLSALDTGALSAEALRERLTADPSFAQVLRGLVGQQINLGGMAVSFGEGNQIGDVSIRDLAGRDLITINVYHGAPAVGLAAPPMLTPADIERRWRKALSAALLRQWAQAEPLLAAIAAADPGYRDVQARLAEARRHLGIQSFYADLRVLREADDWQAVLGGLAELEARQPGVPDPEGLRAWAEARQRREERYDAALVAADGGDWGAAVSALEALLAEAPGDADATELLGPARGEREAQREVEVRRAQEQERRRRRVLLTGVVDLVKAGRYDDALAQITEVAAQPDASGDAALVAARIAETAAVPFAERLSAAQLAGRLGDPRFPIAAEQWRAELARRSTDFGQPNGYWCYVRQGAYRIGGWEAKEPEATIMLTGFWLARYPITVAQYAPFVAEGYGNDAERWWTKKGWQWKQGVKRTQPWGWNGARYNGANQPVIGITWYEATAFCAWLSERLDGTLPKDYVLRLPTEAEWEAAAAYDAQMQRRNYPWGDEEPTLERAIYDEAKLGRPAPVGCCPAGVAACGTLDLAGNVWELTVSESRAYPVGSHELQKDFTRGQTAWRGGGWAWNSSNVRCGARDGYDLDGDDGNLGFRVVLAPVLIADNR